MLEADALDQESLVSRIVAPEIRDDDMSSSRQRAWTERLPSVGDVASACQSFAGGLREKAGAAFPFSLRGSIDARK